MGGVSFAERANDQPAAFATRGLDKGRGIGGGGRGRLLRRPQAQASDPRARAVRRGRLEIGRASCRDRVCQSGEISVVALSLTKTARDNLCVQARTRRVNN